MAPGTGEGCEAMRVEWVKEAAEGMLASAAGSARRIVRVREIGRGAVSGESQRLACEVSQ